MKLRLILLQLASIIVGHDAHQAIFQSPASQHVQHSNSKHGYADEVLSRPLPRPRVAVIGGGAGGTSAAFFLNFLGQQEPHLKVDIDLFEANDYLGGRSTVVYPFHDETYPAIELGASIFVPVNKNLWKAVTKEFNLTLQSGHGGGASSEEDDGGMAIWNGERFVYRESGYSWWNLAKMAWRYGWASPLNTRDAVSSTVDRFTKLYSSEFQSKGPYESIEALAARLNLDQHAYKTTLLHLRNSGVNELFVQELVAAATRVNYGQNPSEMQAFEGMVAMAASGASSTVNGNRQIFERFARASGARVHLDTQVEKITRLSDGNKQWLITTLNKATGIRSLSEYDAVIFSAPMHPPKPILAPSVKFLHSDIPTRIPELDYVRLHVTILVTNATQPRSEYFDGSADVSKTILSTFEPFAAGKVKSRPKLNSLNYLRNLGNLSETSGEGHVVKIFSDQMLLDTDLLEIFGASEVFWAYRKEWAAYPCAPPFAEDEQLPRFKPDNSSHFYYVNAMERWVSTMETETVSAWNVVSLLVRDMFGYSVQKSWAEW